MKNHNPFKNGKSSGIAFGLTGAIFWALDSTLLAMVLAPFESVWFAPVVTTFLHDSVSAIVLLVNNVVTGKMRDLIRIFRYRESLWLILAGLLGGPVGMSGYVFCISYLGAGLGAVLSCLYPAFGLIFSFLFFRQRFSKKQVFGLLLSLAGVAVISLGSGISYGNNIGLGLLCGLVCAIGWSLEGIAAQKGTEKGRISSEQALSIRQCISSLTFGLILVPLVHGWPMAADILKSSFILIAVAGICGTVSYLCYYKAISLISAGRAMPLNITYCAWAIVFTSLFQQTWPPLIDIVAAAAVVSGALLCAGQRKAEEPETKHHLPER